MLHAFLHQHALSCAAAQCRFLRFFPFAWFGYFHMTSQCKGGGKFVGKWNVSVRNTTPCPVCRSAQPVRPYGDRYRIAEHQEEKDKRAAGEPGDENKAANRQ